MITIEHHGGASGVTGSCHRLRIAPDRSLLIDCGLFQGADLGGDDILERHRVDFPVDDVLALIVTHVHIDHIGRLPHLLAAGYTGPIIASQPSARLLPLVLEDALKIGFTRERELIERFNTLVGDRLQPLDYAAWHTLVDDERHQVRLRMQRAGHILGSAWVEIDVTERSGDTPGRNTRAVFSGDLGPPATPLLPAPTAPERADLLVLESTYGDRIHEQREQRREHLRRVIDHAHTNGGTVIVPAFSIGRTQELLYEIEAIIYEDGDERWHHMPIVVDSPLAARFTRVYRDLRPWWDAEAHQRLHEGRHPLAFDNLVTIGDHDEHERVVERLASGGEPAVVIAASGMCVGGRVIDYLDRMLEDERHHVVFVGYQASGTLGRAIQQAGQGGSVRVRGRQRTIAAGVDTVSGYSAHADRDDLISFVRGIRNPPQEIRLVHGEADARHALASVLTPYAGRVIADPE